MSESRLKILSIDIYRPLRLVLFALLLEFQFEIEFSRKEERERKKQREKVLKCKTIEITRLRW